MKIHSLQNDTVDAICWRFYRQTSGQVEQVLRDNPGLADLGAILPAGTVIQLAETATTPTTPRLQLWD
ncbi:tail protein X [Arsenophonus nasoniae]|uniref:Tail protein X n=1 Tax=Arsenophonus nasoniae TaxID=638 RepID=A0AA95GDS7_9GAMM|nr:tail protein X [Arsenophonus nasoniae]WGL95315.1 tail protein X [Arsenophonus nasoniae]